MKLGELIAVARECKGWSLRELEKRTGISNSLLSQIETGHVRDPSWKNVVKIAKALGLKPDRLASCDHPDDPPIMELPKRGWKPHSATRS